VKQENEPKLQRVQQNLNKGKLPRIVVNEDGTLLFHIRLRAQKNVGIRKPMLI